MKQSPVKNIWMIAREYGDLAGAGGVKDVVRQLADALAIDENLSVTIVIPMYGFVQPEEYNLVQQTDPLDPSIPLEFEVAMNYGLNERWESCRVYKGNLSGVDLYLIDSKRFREKYSVYTYTDKDTGAEEWQKPGMGHYDYFAMNLLLQKSSLELMVLLDDKPDVIHCHDGHTALIPALIHECQGWRSYFRDTGCVVTIHNAGIGYHQEVADLPFAQGMTGLSWGCIGNNRLSGKFDPFLAAGEYAILNTVSENYARELQETDEDLRTDWLSHTLLKRGVKIEGITNGINPDDFNPLAGERIGLAASYDPSSDDDDLEGKLRCKSHLLKKLHLLNEIDGITLHGRLEKDATHPLFAFIGRLSEQKGVDYFLESIELLFSEHQHGQALILGTGSAFLEAGIRSLAEKESMRGRLCFIRGYSPELANQIFSACDFFVIPSRYEPCGLTDYIAQLFGAIPVVHHVGGLVKVEKGKTGIAYSGDSVEDLLAALQEAVVLYEKKPALRTMQRSALEVIRKRYTWSVVKGKYVALYERAKERRAKGRATVNGRLARSSGSIELINEPIEGGSLENKEIAT
ncbi:glycogen synthase [Desulfosediminicola flagellatus]|uniref:glycogen synthase n=1 Tax=Desulfosediminicola flagellatus TaxID=2569541 RepID=UPI0010AB5C7A|nr:glycogen/starch synthase [Desulfosediminicola flagellatus]